METRPKYCNSNLSFREESLESDKMDRDKNAEVKDVNKSTMNEKVTVQSGYENEYVSDRYSSDDVQGLEMDGESDCKDKEDEVKCITGEEVMMNVGKIIQNDKKETLM